MPAISTLIKPASGRCNLQCAYCFYNDEASRRATDDFGMMREDTLEAIVRAVFEKAEQSATFSFQGGEPTLRGLPFYRRLIELQSQYNKNNIKVLNCLQTNGILIDEQWAQFLAEQQFLVGLSLDGPKAIHDKFRRDKRGEPTFKRVLRAAQRMDAAGAQYNILFTVTSEAAKEPGKVYTFFKENGMKYLQFMPCIDPFAAQRGGEDFSLLPDEFALFLRKFFDRWAADVLAGDGISVRYFDNLLSMAAGYPPEACSMQGHCACQFVFEADGSCYPCDFYVNENWCLGNIHTSSLDEMFTSETARRFLAGGSRLAARCKDCEVLRLCRGGCRRDRENPQYENYYCRAYKSFLSYSWPKFRQLAAFLLQQRRES